MGTALGAVLVASGVLVASFVPEPKPARSAPSENRIEICHRTNAKNNPYRRIRVGWGAVQNSGHGGHNGAEFDISDPAGNTSWGDIFFGTRGGTSRDKNWDSGGKAIFGVDSGGLRITPATYSYNGATRTACKGMTASEYMTSETTAAASGGGGRTLSQVLTDLDDQEADEDGATLRNLGYSTFAAWKTANSSKTDAELIAMSQTAEASAPTATTSAATSVGRTTTTVNGSITQNSYSQVLTVYFEYGTDPGLAESTLTTSVGSTTASSASTFSYSRGLTGLTASTVYYFRIYAENSDQSVLLSGPTLSFTTSSKADRTLTLSAFSASYAFDVGTKPTASATATNDDEDTKTYSSSTTSVCTINSSTGLIAFVDSGTCTIGASIAEGTNYSAATAAELSFTITAATRTLSLAETGGAFSASYAFDVGTKPTALATPSEGAGTITYSSSTTSVCTVNSSSGAITFVDSGSCSLTASIAANLGYATASTSSPSTFTISAVTRSISIDSSSYAASYAQDATGPTLTSTVVGGGAGSKTYSSSTTPVCTVNSSSGLVSFVGTGTCTLTATIAANLGYGAATSPSISFSVTAAALTSRTLNLSSPAASYAFSATPPTFTATPTAGVGQGTKSFTSSTTSICTIDSSSGVVSFVDAGTCTIGASITSGGGFAAATATSESFMITAISRSISIDSGSYAASYARNATPPTVTSTVVGGGSGSKSYTSSTTSVCTVTSGGVVTFEDTGTCTLTASIAANLGYGAATSSAISFTITSPGGGGGGGGGGGTTTSTTTAATSTTAAPATTTTTIATAVATTTTSTTTTTTSTTTTTLAPRRIKICHATASRTNPYVEITVDINGLNGHGDHPGDIIPAPAAGCSRAAIAAATSTTTSSTVVRGRGGTTTTVGPTATVPQRQQITICHATKSATNPYVEITVDLDGLNGHGDHGDDIIPAPAGGCDAKAVKDAAKEAQVVAKKVEAKERITICHATGSESNPYVEITIDVDGLAGHADHEGDIIPAPAGGCSGQALKKVAEVKQQKNNGRITICHATNSATNPFVEITVDMDGLNGHGDHANDIIPAPAEGCPKQVTPDVREKMVRNNERIKICHATGSDTNPYVEITIDTDGLAGHADHPGDIIPAPAEGCGRNAIAKEVEKRSKPNGKITICHATGSARNPYVEITIDADGLAGHGDHLDDIIPAPIGGCGQKQIEERLVDLGIKEPETIDICHATKDPSRPYVKETVAFDSLDGHGQHNGDIVPAPAAGCSCGAIDAALMGKSAPEGSLLDTLSDVNAERNGGAATDLYELVDTKGKKSGSKGGSVTLTPEEDAPSMQLLSATVDDGSVKLNVTSSGVDYNKPSVWQAEGFGAFCWKLEPFGDNDYRYLLPSPSAPPDSRYAGLPYSAVIVKAGSIKESDPDYQVNTLFMNPSGGTEVFADINRNGISDPGGQGGGLLGDKSISHIILCVGEGEFEEVVTTTTTSTTVPAGTPTTLAPTTTTTVPTRVMVNACPKPDGDPTPTTTTTTTVPGGATTTTTIGAATTTTAPGATTTTAPGGTTSTTTVGGTTSTTAGGATTTTAPGGTTSTTAPGATTTTTVGVTTSTTAPGATTTTTPGGTTSTTAPGATTTTAPGGTTSTTAPGATTTTVGGTTSTTAPGATTTTVVGTTPTTAPGATTITLPPGSDSPPPLTFDITPPPGQPLPKEATITLVVSTGSDVETMVLTVDLVDFEPQFDYVTFDESAPADTKPDRTLDQLPKTGGPRWTIEQQIGWLLGLFGLLLMSVAVKPARRHRRRRGA